MSRTSTRDHLLRLLASRMTPEITTDEAPDLCQLLRIYLPTRYHSS